MSPDPEDRRGPDTGGSDPDRSLDDFERIVAGWRREGPVPQWPADTPASDGGTDGAGSGAAPRAGTGAGGDTDPFERWEAAFAASPAPREQDPGGAARPRPASEDRRPDADEHFVPPEPPPLPRLGPPALVGLTLLLLGLLLIAAPAVLGLSSVYGLPLGLLALAAGLGWLVLRLWPSQAGEDPDGDDNDDGAVI